MAGQPEIVSVILMPKIYGPREMANWDTQRQKAAPKTRHAPLPSHDPQNELRGRAARRRAWEAGEKTAGRRIPGVTGGTGSPGRAGSSKPEGGIVPSRAKQPQIDEESTYTMPAGTTITGERYEPERTPGARESSDPNRAGRAKEQLFRGSPGEAEQIERRKHDDGGGGAAQMLPAGGMPQQGGPVSGYNVKNISRSQARAATARAMQYAQGGTDVTGEDLERMNRESNAKAREQHDAQQLAARQSGRISRGSFMSGYDRPVSPHGRGHEYYG